MAKEIKDRRVIVVDENTKQKYTAPDCYEAGFIMNGTGARVSNQIKSGKESLVYGRYRVYSYSETKWEELRKDGYKDGKLYDIYKMRLDSLFGGVYR